MFLVFPVFLGLLSQTTAQSTTNPFAAATTDLSAPTGICNDEKYVFSSQTYTQTHLTPPPLFINLMLITTKFTVASFLASHKQQSVQAP
jgi:hypothetical protein